MFYRSSGKQPKPLFVHKLLLITVIYLLITISSCSDLQDRAAISTGYDKADGIPWAYEGIHELRKGDIIVKPNLNILPGTAYIPGGWGYGHAAIVTKGAESPDPDTLLMNVMIFESHARDVPQIHQLREIGGYVLNPDPAFSNDSFGPQYKGGRYRLRLNITENQVDSIIGFIRSQKGSYSSWNAMKRFSGMPDIDKMVNDGTRENWADNTHWYCSLLVWQAVLYVAGIDLDSNGGYFVYPSDLIASPHFDNTPDHKGRIRF